MAPAVSDILYDKDDYIDALQTVRDDLLEPTKQWQQGEYEVRDRFRGAITWEALGLVGMMVHLLDLVDIDVIFEIRVPSLPKFDSPDEVRRALRALSADGLLANAPPTVRDVVAALLRADRPLSQTELAERAGRSTRSLREHLPRLEALGLVEATDQGYRLRLSFCTSEERYADIQPALTAEDLLLAQDVLYDAAALEDPPDAVWSV